MASNGYGKRPLWQWVLIYLVLGALIYGAVYYLVLAKGGGGYKYSNPNPPAQMPKSGSDNY